MFEIVIFTVSFLVSQTAKDCNVCGVVSVREFDYARARLGHAGNNEGDLVMRNNLHLLKSSCLDRIHICMHRSYPI